MVNSVFIIIMRVLFYSYCMSTSRYTLLPLGDDARANGFSLIDGIIGCLLLSVRLLQF